MKKKFLLLAGVMATVASQPALLMHSSLACCQDLIRQSLTLLSMKNL